MAVERPFIETERLILRPIALAEARQILQQKQPDGLVFAEGYPGPFSLEVMNLLAGERSAEPVNFEPWFIIRKREHDVIGDTGWSTPLGPNRPTVGYDIIEPLWGQGYATEALRGLLGYLFSQPEVESVQADTLEEHLASRRVMEKAGMARFDTRRETVDGEEQTLVFYEIRRESTTQPAYDQPRSREIKG